MTKVNRRNPGEEMRRIKEKREGNRGKRHAKATTKGFRHDSRVWDTPMGPEPCWKFL